MRITTAFTLGSALALVLSSAACGGGDESDGVGGSSGGSAGATGGNGGSTGGSAGSAGATGGSGGATGGAGGATGGTGGAAAGAGGTAAGGAGGTAAGPCQTCIATNCQTEIGDCQADTECSAILACLQQSGCGRDYQCFQAQCGSVVQNNLGGLTMFQAIATCGQNNCATDCGGVGAGGAGGGSGQTCQDCTTANCSSQESACTNDTGCTAIRDCVDQAGCSSWSCVYQQCASVLQQYQQSADTYAALRGCQAQNCSGSC